MVIFSLSLTFYKKFKSVQWFEGSVFNLKGAFNGNYRVLKHSHDIIEMEAYLPNHSLIILTRKKNV